jgi:hypothetical protein
VTPPDHSCVAVAISSSEAAPGTKAIAVDVRGFRALPDARYAWRDGLPIEKQGPLILPA